MQYQYLILRIAEKPLLAFKQSFFGKLLGSYAQIVILNAKTHYSDLETKLFSIFYYLALN